MLNIRGFAGALALVAASALQAIPATAGDSNGNFQAKIGVTGVLTQDHTSSLIQYPGATDLLAAGAFASTDNTVIPSLTLTYYLNKNLAVELFCCFDKVHVRGEGILANTGNIAETWIFPPILTAQYHFDNFGPIRPYVGVGVQYVHYFSSDLASNGLGLPAGSTVHFSDSWGFALQGGVDYDLGGGWSLGVDVKKVWEDTKVTWSAPGGTSIVAKHDIDPIFVTANLGYRFNLSDLFGSRAAPAPLK